VAQWVGHRGELLEGRVREARRHGIPGAGRRVTLVRLFWLLYAYVVCRPTAPVIASTRWLVASRVYVVWAPHGSLRRAVRAATRHRARRLAARRVQAVSSIHLPGRDHAEATGASERVEKRGTTASVGE
jgi:hypothetical protein